MKKETRITWALLGVYLILLTWIILFKMQVSLSDLPDVRTLNLIPFGASVIVNGRLHWEEILQNAVVFLPVGLYLGMLRPRWPVWKQALPIFGLSLAYEALQFAFALGATDITDLIMNTAGGFAGLLLTRLFTKLWKARAVTYLNRLALLATALVLALVGALVFYNL